ncbi:MAG: PepSY-like domain-containing protein [Bacteroidales bacterium]|jgi:hypothetical protein|nr:PepSY-like domain-containing protein [Bacteroidales bacterium]
MKVLLKLGMILSLSTLFLYSCENSKTAPNASLENTFQKMYPNAKYVEWERERGYYVAEFRDSGYEKEAWFDKDYNWVLTKTEYERKAPNIIKEAIAQTEYRDWRIDDVDFIETRDNGSFYIVEVEKGEREVDLYFSGTGEFIKVVYDDDDYHREIF